MHGTLHADIGYGIYYLTCCVTLSRISWRKKPKTWRKGTERLENTCFFRAEESDYVSLSTAVSVLEIKGNLLF
jgi:hypothetical protein